MRYYPVNLDVQGKKVLVVGAGKVALQKVEGLIPAGAEVFVLALDACPEIRQLAQESKLRLELGAYEKKWLEGAFLVFAATNNSETNRRIHQDALQEKILLNAVDQPKECDFTIPARICRGELLIAISSGGKAPFLSKILRRYFEKKIPQEWDEIMLSFVALREKLLQQGRGKEFADYMSLHGDEIAEALFERPGDFKIEGIQKALGV